MSVELNQKAREIFGNLAMNKQRLPSSGLSKLGVPAYVGEWVLEEIVPGEGVLSAQELENLSSFTAQMIPRKNEENIYKNRLLTRETISILAHLNVEVVINRNNEDRLAKLPALGFNDLFIPDAIIEENENLLKQGMWRIVDLASAKGGGIQIVGFEPMQASVNLKAFREKRSQFSADEWRDLMLVSYGYNPSAYTVNQQIWILCRLLPLVQKNMHLMELAPKGTGKSFIYKNISPLRRAGKYHRQLKNLSGKRQNHARRHRRHRRRLRFDYAGKHRTRPRPETAPRINHRRIAAVYARNGFSRPLSRRLSRLENSEISTKLRRRRHRAKSGFFQRYADLDTLRNSVFSKICFGGSIKTVIGMKQI